MTAHRTPEDAGIAGDGWQAGFLHALRASGNVSAAARAAIAANDWTAAAAEALDSRWAAQTGRRAQHIARMLRDDRPLHFPQRTIRRDHVRNPD